LKEDEEEEWQKHQSGEGSAQAKEGAKNLGGRGREKNGGRREDRRLREGKKLNGGEGGIRERSEGRSGRD
jgi:hypothetical protein